MNDVDERFQVQIQFNENILAFQKQTYEKLDGILDVALAQRTEIAELKEKVAALEREARSKLI